MCVVFIFYTILYSRTTKTTLANVPYSKYSLLSASEHACGIKSRFLAHSDGIAFDQWKQLQIHKKYVRISIKFSSIYNLYYCALFRLVSHDENLQAKRTRKKTKKSSQHRANADINRFPATELHVVCVLWMRNELFWCHRD